jgi:PucR family transcriptional regulator, purine catabolism regulatory protein
MGVSASRLLNTPVFATAQVLTGEKVLEDTEIKWASIIEMPVENFRREQEFVLTTGIGCEGAPELMEQFVQDVMDSGASILAIATGRHIFDVPDRIIALAEKHNFILVEIPWAVRAGDILSTVFIEINRGNDQEKQSIEEIRQDFINRVLQEGDIQEITEILYRHTGFPSMVTEYDGSMRAFYKVDSAIVRAVEEGNMKRPKDYEINHYLGLEGREHRLHPHIYVYDIEGERWCRTLINTNHRKQGFFWFHPAKSSTINSFVMNVVEHAVTACALYFVKENAIEMTEIRLKDNFILQLAKESNGEDQLLRSKGELLGYDLSLPYLCVVGKIHSRKKERLFPDLEEDNPPTSSLQNINYYIQKEINNAARFLSRKTMTTFDENEVIIYLETDPARYTETAGQFLDSVDRRLNDLLTEVGISWGIALKREEASGFHASYREAKSALDIGISQDGTGSRTFYKDTRINRLLLAVAEIDHIGKIVEETVGPLADYDRKRNTDLIETFITYNKYNGNVSQTARALHLHRQSLLYRLRNIEALTNLSLIQSDDVFLLELTIRLWKMKKLENSYKDA